MAFQQDFEQQYAAAVLITKIPCINMSHFFLVGAKGWGGRGREGACLWYFVVHTQDDTIGVVIV